MELIKHGQTGLVADTSNPKSFAVHLEILINDENLRKKIGQNARKNILRKYDQITVCNNLKALYYE